MKKVIEFHLIHDFKHQYIIPPMPSKKLLPEWLKKMSNHNTNKDSELEPTIKKCVPVLDAMTAGYTLLTHMDIVLSLREDRQLDVIYLDENHKEDMLKHPPIEQHGAWQVPGSPFEHMNILKYMNPWRISTPANYSLLFLPPVNRFELPIIPLVGLVDTDNFKNVVNIPFLHTELVPGGDPILLSAGTPMCQVIPIQRADWTENVTYLDASEVRSVKNYRTIMDADRTDWYKRKVHTKKNFS